MGAEKSFIRRAGCKAGVFSLVALILLSGAMAGAIAQAPVTVRLWNYNIADKKYQQTMYKLFNQRHPDIKIEYSSIALTAYDQTLEASYIAQEPPDLFLPSGKLSFPYLRTKGWIKPLNDVAPTKDALQQWMAKFPPGLNKFVDGLSVIDGKVYFVNLTGDAGGLNIAFYYNKTLFRETGLAKPPGTQSELRQVAAKIAQAGGGKFFGITHGLRARPTAWHQDIAGSLAWAAGVQGQGGPLWGPSLVDGRYHTGSPGFVTSMKTWIGMRTDGSVFPGDTGMDDEQAKTAFATNKAGMFFGGSWVPGNVLAYNPDADFDLVLSPTLDDGIPRGYAYVGLSAGFGYLVSGFTKNPVAVWKVIEFLSSLEYQAGYVKGGFGFSYLPEASKPENFLVKQMYTWIKLSTDPALQRIMPLRPSSTEKASMYARGIYPIYEDVMDSVYLGKSGFEALTDLDMRCDAALDEGIKKAQAEGIKVTRADYSFPDWDPSTDYVPKKK